MRPSRKRQLLALYIDFLVFSAVYQPLVWALRSTVPLDNWPATLAVFGILRAAAWALKRAMPGQWALGIDSGPAPIVAPHVLARERWWTMTAAALLVLEGSKNAVRWTQGLPVEPLLGLAAPQWMATMAITIFGGLNILAGLLIFRTRPLGAAIGTGVLGVEALAAIVHRADFHEWASQAVLARRSLQGLPVREGEVAMMQALTTTVLPGVLVAAALWLLFVAAHFRRNDHSPASAAGGVRGPLTAADAKRQPRGA